MSLHEPHMYPKEDHDCGPVTCHVISILADRKHTPILVLDLGIFYELQWGRLSRFCCFDIVFLASRTLLYRHCLRAFQFSHFVPELFSTNANQNILWNAKLRGQPFLSAKTNQERANFFRA
jgi:hypothetical protein